MMPQIDWEQFIQILKKLRNDTPVVVISAYVTKDRILRLVQKGVRDILQKPFKVPQFYTVIDKIYPVQSIEN